MKVCIISHAWPPEKLGGAEIYAQRIAQGLYRRGHEVIVITQEPFKGISSLFPKKKIENGIEIYSFYPLNIFSIYRSQGKALILKAMWRIIDLVFFPTASMVLHIIKKEKPQIIHLVVIYGFSPPFLLFLLKKTPFPTVASLHNYSLFCLRCDYLKPGLKECRKKNFFCRLFIKISARLTQNFPHYVISPSNFCLTLHRENGLFVNSCSVILPNGIEISPDTKENILNLNNRKFTILAAGRLEKNKGFHILIKAFLTLPEDSQLIICGDGSFSPELKKLTQNSSRILFIGKVPAEKMAEYYKIASVTVVPSLFAETFCQVAAESLAYGKPVIASRIGALPELIEEGKNGFLFSPGDSEEMAKILNELIKEPEKLKAMSEYARLSAEKFKLDYLLDNLEKIYAQNLSQNT